MRSGYVDIESLTAERADVRQHVGEINKQLIHGDPLGRKPDYVARIAFENPNGLSPWNTEKQNRTVLLVSSEGLHLMPTLGQKGTPTGTSCHMKANLRTFFKIHMG